MNSPHPTVVDLLRLVCELHEQIAAELRERDQALDRARATSAHLREDDDHEAAA